MLTMHYTISPLDIEEPSILEEAIQCDLERIGIKDAEFEIPENLELGDEIEVKVEMKPSVSVYKMKEETL